MIFRLYNLFLTKRNLTYRIKMIFYFYSIWYFYDRIRIGTTARPGDHDIALFKEAKRDQETSATSENSFDQRINQSFSSKRELGSIVSMRERHWRRHWMQTLKENWNGENKEQMFWKISSWMKEEKNSNCIQAVISQNLRYYWFSKLIKT